MGADLPKQYLQLGARTLLEHSVRALMSDARVERVVVVVSPADQWAARLPLPAAVALVPKGGSSRAETVRNGLRWLTTSLAAEDRVLVHDAARPCLAACDLSALIDAAGAHEAGGLLAAPVADTLKRAEGGAVAGTVDRRGLWGAQTPQLFAFGILLRALDGEAELDSITDECSAVERLGLRPRLVAAAAPNPKVTTPADLPLAEAVLKAQGRW